MILGIESDLFMLDYHTLEWKFVENSVKFTHILSKYTKYIESSLQTHL